MAKPSLYDSNKNLIRNLNSPLTLYTVKSVYFCTTTQKQFTMTMTDKIISTDDLQEGINLTDSEYNYLHGFLDMGETGFDVLDLFEGDPNYIEIDDFHHYFLAVPHKGRVIYIVYRECNTQSEWQRVTDALKQWFNGRPESGEKESNATVWVRPNGAYYYDKFNYNV